MNFRTTTSLLASALIVGVLAPSAAVGAEPAELAGLVEEVRSQNPKLAVLRSHMDALEADTKRASAWKDLQISLAYQNVPIDAPVLGEEPMSMVSLKVSQTVPLFGTTELRADVVREARLEKRWEVAELGNALVAKVKVAYYQLGLARQLRTVTRRHVELVEQLIGVARARYEVGKAPQHTLFRLEVLRDRLQDDVSDLSRQERRLSATLNAAAHRPMATEIVTPEAFVLPSAPDDSTALRKVAVASRPAFDGLKAKEARFRAAGELARAEVYPDPTLFAAYGLRAAMDNGNPGRDLVTVGITVPIPVSFDARANAPVRSAAARVASVGAERAALLDDIDRGIEDGLARWSRAASKVGTYRDALVPGARRTLDSTLTAYQVDQAQFVTLFDTQLDLLNFERAIRIAIVDGLIARTDLELLVGKELQ